jgi:hypothetical protein
MAGVKGQNMLYDPVYKIRRPDIVGNFLIRANIYHPRLEADLLSNMSG